MIITKKKALSICSSVDIVKDITALHSVFEDYQEKQRESKKGGCSRCQANQLFSSVENSALQRIMSLGKEDILKLQKHLNTTEPLYAYSSSPAGVKSIQLGV